MSEDDMFAKYFKLIALLVIAAITVSTNANAQSYYNNQGYGQQQYAYASQNQYNQSNPVVKQQGLNSQVVQRLYLTSDYIIQNPSRADFYVQRLLGINTQLIDLNNLQRVAYGADKTSVARELAWLYQNKQQIESGNFNDARYSLSRQEVTNIKTPKINPQLTEGLSSTWAWGGLGLAAAGGLVAALSGGGGSSGTIDSTGPDQRALQELAVCEPTTGLNQGSFCQICKSGLLSSDSQMNRLCGVTTEQIVTLSETNPLGTSLELFCEAVNNDHFLCESGTTEDYCDTSSSSYDPVLCGVCEAVGNDSWLCSGGNGTPPDDGGTPPDDGGTPPGDGGTPPGEETCPPDDNQAFCEFCQDNPGIDACEELFGDGGTPPGDGGTPPGDGGTPPGDGFSDSRSPIAFVDDPADYVNSSVINNHPNNALIRLGAHYAYARGIDGSGDNTFIGIIDWFPTESQLTSSSKYAWFQSMFDGRLTELSLNPSGDTTGNMSIGGASNVTHGTVVAAWAAADNSNTLNVQGYANGVEDIRLRSMFNGGDPYGAMNWAANQGTDKVGFFNNSWGSGPTGSFDVGQLRQVLDRGHNLIMAAGNDGYSGGSGSPAKYADQATNSTSGTGVMVSVVAVHSSGSSWTRASYSNVCGDLYYCMSAPAGDPSSPIGASGTSFAAPGLTGQMALLHSGWDFLSGQQVFEILKETATDLGATGRDNIYGWGIANLEAAFNPVGTSSLALASGAVVNLEDESASILVAKNSPFGNALNNIASVNTVTITDDFGRDFEATSLNSAIIDEDDDKEDFADTGKRIGTSNAKPASTKVTENLSLRLSSANLSQEQLEAGSFEAFADYKINNDVSMSVGFTREVVDVFNNDNKAFNVNNFISNEVFEMPYIQFADEAKVLTTGIGYKFSDSLSTKMTTLYSSDEDFASFAASVLEIGYKPNSKLGFNFKQGLVLEFDTLFGTQSTGVLDISDGAKTMFAGLDINYDFNDKWNLFASAYMGITSADAGQRSLFSNVEDMITDSYNIALTRKEIFGSDSLTVALSQPLRVISGSANGVTYRVNNAGQSSITGFSHDLTPSGRTVKFQSAYQKNIQEDLDMFISAEVVKDDNHDEDSETEYSVVGKVKYKF